MFRSFLFIGVIAFLLTACSSGKTAFNRGHYDLAVKQASHRLNQRTGLNKRGRMIAPLVLKQAFIRAYEQHQTTIQRLSAPTSTDPFRWEVVHKEYTALQTLTDDARKCALCADWLAAYPVSYTDRQRDTRELAAADRYEVAEQAFAYRKENRLAAKDAYLNYRKANEWVADFRQARVKAEDVFPFAVLRVVVEPLRPTVELSPEDNRELQRLILRQIGQNTIPSKFVRFYPLGADSPRVDSPRVDSPDEPVGDGYSIHQAIQMVITEYVPYRENNSSSSTTVYSNQEYKVGEKKINDSTKVDVKEKVKGTLTTYQREIYASLGLSMRGVDTQTGKVLWEEPIWESRNWKTEWQTFSGDNRALNGQTLKSANVFPPSRWRLYDSMQDELAGDVARRLQGRYAQD